MIPSAEERLREKQNTVTWAERERIAVELAEATRKMHPSGAVSQDTSAPLGEIRKMGLCRLPRLLDGAACEDVMRYFQSTSCFNAHVPAQSDGIPRSVKETSTRSHYGSYTVEQSLLSPHLASLAMHPQILGLVEGYLNCVPTLYSINTFWTFPLASPGLTHDFHRDLDDYRFVAVFIYWTEVSVREGEFLFLPRTHCRAFVSEKLRPPPLFPFPRAGPSLPMSEEQFLRLGNGHGYGHSEYYRTIFGESSISAVGPPGTVFAADTFGLHKGTPPSSRWRLCTWMRFGLYANCTYQNDRAPLVSREIVGNRIPTDDRSRYITRLLIKD